MSTVLGDNAISCSSGDQTFEPREPQSAPTPQGPVTRLALTLESLVEEKARLAGPPKRLRLRCGASTRGVVVGMPPFELRQAFSDLIDLALEATSKGGGVLVTARAHHDGVTVRIHDQGTRTDEVTRNLGKTRLLAGKLGGNGLGVLEVTRGFETHGGRMLVASVPRRGTSITVTLPLAGEAHPTALVAPSCASIDDDRSPLPSQPLPYRRGYPESTKSAQP